MNSAKTLLLLILGQIIFYSCSPSDKYKQDLRSDNVSKICEACYELGQAKDTSAVKLLLTNILDPRISHHIRFKGMSVAQCRLTALKKISNIDVLRKDNRYIPDTTAVLFYLDWAFKEGHLRNKSEVNIYYSN
jgi:hypothetical protein